MSKKLGLSQELFLDFFLISKYINTINQRKSTLLHLGLADAVVALEVAPCSEADPAVEGADPVAVGECSVGPLAGRVVVGTVPPVQGLPCTVVVVVGAGSCQVGRQHLVNYSPCLQ